MGAGAGKKKQADGYETLPGEEELMKGTANQQRMNAIRGTVGAAQGKAMAMLPPGQNPNNPKLGQVNPKQFKEKVRAVDKHVNANGDSILHEATKRCNIEEVQTIIGARATVDIRNDDERTPLHMAASLGLVPMIEVLVDSQADLASRDIDGRTPLHLATMHGFEESLNTLLRLVITKVEQEQKEEGEGVVNKNEQVDKVAEIVCMADNIGRTAALWAVYSGYMRQKQMDQEEREIENKRQQVKSRQIFYNLLMMASGNQVYPCWGSWREFTVESKAEKRRELARAEMDRLNHVVQLCVRYMGGSANSKQFISHADFSGATALHLTLFRSQQDRQLLWEIFLEPGVDFPVDAFIGSGPAGPLLHHCAQVGDQRLMEFICANLPKEFLGVANAFGDTALHIAAKRKHVEVAQTLVASGAPTDAVDSHNKTAGDIAMTTGDAKLTKIVAHEASINDFAGAGRLNDVELLLSKRSDVDRRDRDGRTPLMAACLCKHDAIVGVLIDGRANVNAKDRAGFTAVSWLLNPHQVDSAETLKILRTLINAGLDVKQQLPCAGMMAGSTLLIVAAKSGFAKVCGQVIAASADLEARDAAGRTALMHAVQKESPEVVRVLFDARADPSAQDAKGFTPSTVALSSADLELREILAGGAAKKKAGKR
jgi:ankyrin repeat protein